MKVRGLPIWVVPGATSYEVQIWRIWLGVYRPSFMRTCGLGYVRWVTEEQWSNR